jgi:hypothetical protein
MKMAFVWLLVGQFCAPVNILFERCQVREMQGPFETELDCLVALDAVPEGKVNLLECRKAPG